MKLLTSNEYKLIEMQAFIPELEMFSIDLSEIQSLDPHEIVKAKLDEARSITDDDLIVDDTSLTFDCLGGLPGPFIKHFITTLGIEKLADLVLRYDEHGATVQTIIGYASGDRIEFFEGTVRGTIVSPRGSASISGDLIFQPDGYDKTYAELGEEKKRMSHRTKAVEKLVEFLRNT